MELKFEIGDTFKIDTIKIYKLSPRIKPCLYPDKVFVIDHFSKSGQSAYYIDYRTSIKCKCNLCVVYDKEIILGGGVIRSISISNIILFEKKKQRERNIKLKLLLKNN